MKRPKQLAAVDRNSNKCASVPVGANTGPSALADWSSIINYFRPLAIDGAGATLF
jgi:hypothetical protein